MAAYSILQSILVDDPNCVGLWTLDDVYTDSSGNGNTLTPSGSPAFATGKFNNGLDLELSSSQYASITDAAQTGLDITGDFSFSLWLKLEQLPSTATTNFAICGKYLSTGNQRSYRILIGSDDKLNIQYSGDGTNITQIISTSAAFVAGDVGNFRHLAVAVDVSAKTAIAYKNNVSIAFDAAIGTQTSVFNGTAVFDIGNGNTAAPTYFDGIIDDLGVFDRLLTATEIGQIYDGTIPRRIAGGSPIFFGNTAIA